jgi:hypothetical protein
VSGLILETVVAACPALSRGPVSRFIARSTPDRVARPSHDGRQGGGSIYFSPIADYSQRVGSSFPQAVGRIQSAG